MRKNNDERQHLVKQKEKNERGGFCFRSKNLDQKTKSCWRKTPTTHKQTPTRVSPPCWFATLAWRWCRTSLSRFLRPSFLSLSPVARGTRPCCLSSTSRCGVSTVSRDEISVVRTMVSNQNTFWCLGCVAPRHLKDAEKRHDPKRANTPSRPMQRDNETERRCVRRRVPRVNALGMQFKMEIFLSKLSSSSLSLMTHPS